MKQMSKILCPNIEDHTVCPKGYFQWQEWAANMTKTYTRCSCNGCGLLVIWKPKAGGMNEGSP